MKQGQFTLSSPAVQRWIAHSRAGALVAVTLLLALMTAPGATPIIDPGDINISVLVTGGISPLISRITSISVDTNSHGGRVEFDVGFATQEFSIGNLLVDSLTVTLLDRSEQAGAVLCVVDVNGAAWTPSVPGAVALPSGYLAAAEIELPEIRMGLPGLNTQFAYHLSVRLPAALWGPSVKLALDVFDYPNGLVSIAWNGPATFISDILPPCAPPPLGLAAWWKAEGNALGPASARISSGLLSIRIRRRTCRCQPALPTPSHWSRWTRMPSPQR